MALPNATVSDRGRPEDKTTPSILRRRFGDEQSTLLDRFERLSFEAHLNQAMLARSRSESSAASRNPADVSPPLLPMPLAAQVCQGRRGTGLSKILKKLLKPIKLCRRKAAEGRKQESQPATDPRDPRNWKAFSKSLRSF